MEDYIWRIEEHCWDVHWVDTDTDIVIPHQAPTKLLLALLTGQKMQTMMWWL